MVRKIVFSLVLTALLVVAFEIGSAVFLYHAHQDRLAAQSAAAPHWSATAGAIRTGLQTVLPERYPDAQRSRRMERLPTNGSGAFFSPDEAQGYRANPGAYVFRYSALRGGKREHVDTDVTINPDGTRFTGAAPAEPQRRIFVLGDSFMFGDGVNDGQTLGFLLQAAFARDAVHVHALGGWSWPNALVTLRQLEGRVRPGDVVVLGYAHYYKERHVAAPARLRSIRDWMASSFPDVVLDPKDRLLRARLDGEGKLTLDTIAMHCKFAPESCTAPEPTLEYSDRVSKALLQAIAAATPAQVKLVHLFGPANDAVLTGLPVNVELVRARPEDFSYAMRDDVMGFDDHGGPYWHHAIYTKVRAAISRGD
jgi:hypothetical protein